MENISKLPKDGIMSELNALNYSEWTREDRGYRDKLETEYNKRIEFECKLATQER